MAAVTQVIPNYIGGVSSQPDERKLPGQLLKQLMFILTLRLD